MMTHGFLRLFVSLWIAISMVLPAQAAQMCEYVFVDPTVKVREVDFGLRSESHSQTTPLALVKFAENKQALWTLLEKIQPERKKQIEHLLAAVEFFDYKHTANSILPNFLDGKRNALNFERLYDQSEAIRGAPFKGFINARDNYLRVEKPEVSVDMFTQIHKRIMEGGVEGLTPSDLGALRGVGVIGNAAGSSKLVPKEVQTIETNPYLYFTKTDESKNPLQDTVWSKIKIWGQHREMSIEQKDPILLSGRIIYPAVGTAKDKTIDLIRDSHPDVYLRIIKFRQENPGKEAPASLQQSFVRALLEQRFSQFKTDREALGEIKIGINENQYIDLVADFQRDVVAIHPFRNGNGRTTRLFMNYLLTKEGLPPVRLVDPFLDVQVSQKEWREYVHKGVVNEADLQADIVSRVRQGLTVEYSPDLIYPGLPDKVSISQKTQGSDKEVKNYAQSKVDASQFNAFVKTMMEVHPELRQEIKNDQLRAMSRLADLFVEYYRSKTVRYVHEKDGEREIGLRFVDPDFVDLFGVNRAYSKELWDMKIDRWYDKDMLVWRGLSNKQTEYTNEQLLNYFQTPSTHLLSNSAVKAVREGKSVIEAAKADFNKYNRELLNGDVVQMAVDHHRTGPLYGDSYGYSTSKREVVGKAFAMGAMVVGEYGKHNDPALQAQLKSRINVASYRALKDVDLGRLKAFDPDFSYIYGRQAEVMGIGGTDADAIVLIQRIDAKGDVTQTLLRNIDKPDEILVIDGRYVPGEGPLAPERITQRYKLSNPGADKAQQVKQAEDVRGERDVRPPEPVHKPAPQPGFLNKIKGWIFG
ncbi:Fic family protein [Bdellovibrio bacteriovorus]|uniref:Fic family protein n=1 Tax=Bdellovibrio bacteriovorus TaxID=959 RepID=UPI0009BEA176|nr:Fic family protein [Bdellovibrio bacteriovorus]